MKVSVEIYPTQSDVWILKDNKPTCVKVHSCNIYENYIRYEFYYGNPKKTQDEVFATKEDLVKYYSKVWSV